MMSTDPSTKRLFQPIFETLPTSNSPLHDSNQDVDGQIPQPQHTELSVLAKQHSKSSNIGLKTTPGHILEQEDAQIAEECIENYSPNRISTGGASSSEKISAANTTDQRLSGKKFLNVLGCTPKEEEKVEQESRDFETKNEQRPFQSLQCLKYDTEISGQP